MIHAAVLAIAAAGHGSPGASAAAHLASLVDDAASSAAAGRPVPSLPTFAGRAAAADAAALVAAGRLWALARTAAIVESDRSPASAAESLHFRATQVFGEAAAAASTASVYPDSGAARAARTADGGQPAISAAVTEENAVAARVAWRRRRGTLAALLLRVAAAPVTAMDAVAGTDLDAGMGTPDAEGIGNSSAGSGAAFIRERRVASEGATAGVLRRMAEAEAAIAAANYEVRGQAPVGASQSSVRQPCPEGSEPCWAVWTRL